VTKTARARYDFRFEDLYEHRHDGSHGCERDGSHAEPDGAALLCSLLIKIPVLSRYQPITRSASSVMACATSSNDLIGSLVSHANALKLIG
jgi:hypothetical protein